VTTSLISVIEVIVVMIATMIVATIDVVRMTTTAKTTTARSGHLRHRPREARVYLTVGNRPSYRGNWPYRPEPVTVPAGYQPVGRKFFEFEFQKLKNVEKIPKNTL
jgi:hypothetical protein